jgi:hypothetical protein
MVERLGRARGVEFFGLSEHAGAGLEALGLEFCQNRAEDLPQPLTLASPEPILSPHARYAGVVLKAGETPGVDHVVPLGNQELGGEFGYARLFSHVGHDLPDQARIGNIRGASLGQRDQVTRRVVEGRDRHPHMRSRPIGGEQLQLGVQRFGERGGEGRQQDP